MTSLAPPNTNTNDHDTNSINDSRHTVAKEQWRNLLEQFVAHEEVQELEESCLNATDSGEFSVVGKRRSSIATVATAANTIQQLDELNQDLEHTADNLADLEIEFTEDMQMLHMGFESAFEQWNRIKANTMA